MGLADSFKEDANQPASLAASFTEDAEPMQYTPLETFGLHATNVFGAGPAIQAAVNSVLRGGSYDQWREAFKKAQGESEEQNPRAALAGKVTSIVPETILGGAAGKAIAGGAKLAGIAGRTSAFATKSPILANAIEGALAGAGYGAAGGAGEALSNDTDVLSGAAKGVLPGAVAGGAFGAVAGGISKLAKSAATKADEALIKSVTGEGKAAAELTPEAKDEILSLIRSDPEVRSALAKPAAQAEKAILSRAESVAEKIKPLTSEVDKVTGGISLGKFSRAIDEEIASLSKTPLREAERKSLDEARNSILTAWGGDAVQALQSNEAKESKVLRDALINKLDRVRVPSENFVKLQTEIAADSGKGKDYIASVVKKAIDDHLAEAATKSPEISSVVDQINSLGKQESLLRMIGDAAGKKTEKEAHSGLDKLIGIFTHHGPVGAGLALATGHPLPALALAAPAAAKKGTEFLAYIAREAAAGNPKAIRALKAAQAARSIGTAGAARIGQSQSSTLAESEAQ